MTTVVDRLFYFACYNSGLLHFNMKTRTFLFANIFDYN